MKPNVAGPSEVHSPMQLHWPRTGHTTREFQRLPTGIIQDAGKIRQLHTHFAKSVRLLRYIEQKAVKGKR